MSKTFTNDPKQTWIDVYWSLDKVWFRKAYFQHSSACSDTISSLQHEDGFASGLRIATDYLDAIPPFPLKSPQRDLTTTKTDSIVLTALNVTDSFAKTALALPARWLLITILIFATFASFGLLILERLSSRFRLSEGVQGRIQSVRGGLVEVRGVWERSLGGGQIRKESLIFDKESSNGKRIK